MKQNCVQVIVLLALLLNCFACGKKQYRFEYNNQAEALTWPNSQQNAKIQYLGVIQGESNFVEIEDSEGFVSKSFSWLGKTLFGDAAQQGFYRPQSGYFDNTLNRLYVTDVGSKSVFIFDLTNNNLDIWEGTDELNNFISPIAVCGIENNVYVSDAELGYVAKFSVNGELKSIVGEAELTRPTGLACDVKTKKVYVADSQRHKIMVFDDLDNFIEEFGAKGSVNGKFNSPTHLSIRDNKLYISDTLNARVQIFSTKGKWLQSFGKRGMIVGNLPRPKGIALDSDNHIYVIESFYDYMLIFNQKGQALLPVGGRGSSPGQFYLPAGIWIDAKDRIYVADMFNKRVAVFQYLKNNAMN